MSDKDSRPYEIGHGKPPKEHQFKKGRSGNPGGRPRRSKNLDDIVLKNLDRNMFMNVNGEPTKIKIVEAIIMSQVKKAVEKGDTRAAKFILDLNNKAEQAIYYMETAANYMSKQITRGLEKAKSDPEHAQKIYDEARRFAEDALARYRGETGEDV